MEGAAQVEKAPQGERQPGRGVAQQAPKERESQVEGVASLQLTVVETFPYYCPERTQFPLGRSAHNCDSSTCCRGPAGHGQREPVGQGHVMAS